MKINGSGESEKTNPISKMPKMNVNLYVIEDYENETTFRPKKTNPNKANFFKGQNEQQIACRKIRPHPKKLRFGIKLDFSKNDIRMTGNKNKNL